MDLVSELTDTRKVKVLRVLTIAVAHPDARSVIKECSARGIDLDATLTELSKRLWTN
jgi:hypothetical protein